VTVLAQIIDVGDLLSVIWTSLLAGIGVCFVFSLTIIGFARATDMRREGHGAAMILYSALAVLSLAAVLALVIFGVVVMTAR